ncbi:MAG TPA: nuclear transport factor 2 family protein [Leptospiraceae bacterium]|nr:nuclear transport factor 2 family protein [Leptospiraceae bacterium]HMW07216.1 nuclear transport factor 2 family protein [Leptospiraceae bacterium]HMX33081.1 nuclear transport factor 2 family protein [Leptospiraceae bacterium]HMY32634.1 nuclear transport factor 2 family protein [Leptospiraceae bacterium]HMZ63739.1 nuclear transport factor 2 family protein [Leptospiraceae bacterium]
MKKLLITKEDIIKIENELFSAQLSSNVEVLDKLLFDSLIAVTPNGQIVTKEMDLSSHRDKTMMIEDASTHIDEIQIIEDIAITVVTMKAKGKMMGSPMEGHFKYLRTWKLLDGQLKIIAASIMILPE